MEMTITEALEVVGNGHGVVSVETARAVCEVFKVPFSDGLVLSWESQQQALDCYGFAPYVDASGQGVRTLSLSYHVTKSLGLGAPGSKFSGRGY
jgi:hypothetical protein